MAYNNLLKSDKWKFTIRILMPIVQIFTLIATVILTIFLVISNQKTAEIAESSKTMSESSLETAKLFKTQQLCVEFNSKYWLYNYDNRFKHPEDLDFIHLWTYPEWNWEVDPNIKLKWDSMPKNEKLKILNNSIEMYAILEYFENAKELDKIGYLYRPYFYNFFVTTVKRLLEKDNDFEFKETKPTFTEYIEMKREKSVYTWDGFDYCLINIFIPGTTQEGGDAEWLQIFQNAWNNTFLKFEKDRGIDSVQLKEKYKYNPFVKESYTNKYENTSR